MSYNMSIGKENFNYTYNVSGMWYACYSALGIRTHYGLTGKQAVPLLRNLREYMEDNAKTLRLMEPDNGWGSFDGALDFVSRLIMASKDNPQEIWSGD